MPETTTGIEGVVWLKSRGAAAGDHFALCQKHPSERFTSRVLPVEKAAEAAHNSSGRDVWMSINPIRAGVLGKGKEGDVTALLGLPGDYDVGPGKISSREVAQKAIRAMTEILNAEPTITDSGYGYHAIWAVERTPVTSDEHQAQLRQLGARFHALQCQVLATIEPGATLDNISNLDRILRWPGKPNLKHPTPAPTSLLHVATRPLALSEIEDAIDAHLTVEPEAPPLVHADGPKRTPTQAESEKERRLIGLCLSELRAKRLKPWSPGDEWDNSCFKWACLLCEGVNTPWSTLTEESAFNLYWEAAPYDRQWDERRKCWDRAVAHTAGQSWTPATPSLESLAPVVEAASQAQGGGATTTGSGDVHSGQVRIAHRFAAAYRSKLCYVNGIGWHHYDQTHWVEDQRGYAERAVIDVLEQSLIASLQDEGLRADVNKCESAAGIDGVLRIARSLVEFAHIGDDMDADRELLNFTNGTLNLDTMQLQPHDPADLITKVTSGEYDPGADASQWEAFLAQVIPDPLERSYLQRVFGQALYGRVEEHILPVLTGEGGNGKGVFYGTILHAVGTYGIVTSPEVLLARDQSGVSTEVMDLRGARIAVASETNAGRKFDEAVMKRLTGGDQISARRLYRDPVTFTPSHTIAYVTNNLPLVSADSQAVWRRIRVIPFEVTIPADQMDKQLQRKLEMHPAGVLSWLIAGYADYRRIGMSEPPRVTAATEGYRAASDPVQRFIAEACFVSPAAASTTRVLYAAWQRWAAGERADPLTEKAFSKELDRLGYEGKKTKHGITRKGLMPLSEEAD